MDKTTSERILYLLELVEQRIASEEELREVSTLLDKHLDPALQEKLADRPILSYPPSLTDLNSWQPALRRILDADKIPETTAQAAVRRIALRRWWVAASLLLLVTTGTYLWVKQTWTTSNPPVVSVSTQDISPGKEGAILTLSDGSEILLDTMQNATIALQGGVAARVVNGSLVYEGKGNAIVYNTMRTPKGRQFHVTLPDGTQVWLNSQSAIRYPTLFAGKERKVDIEGEAYFDVVKNPDMPFRVGIRDGASVEVLGTAFNINAYSNEPQVIATLVEGAVKVAASDGNAGSLTLLPGQQARISVQNTATIQFVPHPDMEKALAWKNGQFYFDGATLPEIMRQVERWYDIKVLLPEHIPDIVFVGKMTRGVSLRFLLQSMEDLGVRYRLEGRVLTILPQT